MNIGSLLKKVGLGIGVTILLTLLAAVGFIWFGPVAISDRGMLLNTLIGRGIAAPSPAAAMSQLHVPPGFNLKQFANDLPGVRFMRPTVGGDLLASVPRTGQIVWLEQDRNGDGK